LQYQEMLSLHRNFLLFIPVEAPDLQNILAYFSSTVRLSPEGDVLISDETIAGLGNKIRSFLTPFFRIIFEIATPPRRYPLRPYPLVQYLTPSSFDEEPHPSHYLPPEEDEMEQALLFKDYPLAFQDTLDPDWTLWENLKWILSSCLPTPGYFIAGGLAGAVSRTTTAPLDRLKVYLIAQTGSANYAIEAAKSGAALQALKGAWRTSANAMKDLWAAGGIRSLWAGKFLYPSFTHQY
jgi:solute carrier family 25 phosphate transporter 23/24/25/41